MNNFLKLTESELAEIVAVQCLNAGFSPDDPRVSDVLAWVNDTVINALILSMVVKGELSITGVDSDGGVLFDANELTPEEANSPIWSEISDIITRKDKE